VNALHYSTIEFCYYQSLSFVAHAQWKQALLLALQRAQFKDQMQASFK
jgi:hypothetical protein